MGEKYISRISNGRQKFILSILFFLLIPIILFPKSTDTISISLTNSQFYIGELIGYEKDQVIISQSDTLYVIDTKLIDKMYNKDGLIYLEDIKIKNYPQIDWNNFSKTIIVRSEKQKLIFDKKIDSGLNIGYGISFSNDHTYNLEYKINHENNSFTVSFLMIDEKINILPSIKPKENKYSIGMLYSKKIIINEPFNFEFGGGISFFNIIKRGDYSSGGESPLFPREYDKITYQGIGCPVIMGVNLKPFNINWRFSLALKGNINFNYSFFSILLSGYIPLL